MSPVYIEASSFLLSCVAYPFEKMMIHRWDYSNPMSQSSWKCDEIFTRRQTFSRPSRLVLSLKRLQQQRQQNYSMPKWHHPCDNNTTLERRDPRHKVTQAVYVQLGNLIDLPPSPYPSHADVQFLHLDEYKSIRFLIRFDRSFSFSLARI